MLINKETKAGGVIVKKINNDIYVLLLHRQKENDWSFPKGHIEPNENINQAVFREIKEETGLDVVIIKELKPNKYLNTRTNKETITYMYLLKPLSFDLKQEFKGDKLEWVKFDEVENRLSYGTLKDYFNQIKNELFINS
ncbi:MAG: NUDIX hydrolase [Patescibacteria group bacterium]